MPARSRLARHEPDREHDDDDGDELQQHAICDDICYQANAQPEFARAAQFFSRFRDLTVGGFYSTPAGRQDLGYIGNVPLSKFDPPPPELLHKLGLGST